jgi:hypothetical protein
MELTQQTQVTPCIHLMYQPSRANPTYLLIFHCLTHIPDEVHYQSMFHSF